MNRLDSVDKSQLKTNVPDFQPGDTVRVHVRIKESETKERLQAFEGVVIARKHGGVRETVTVRKTSFGVGVERITCAAQSCIICVVCAAKLRASANAIRVKPRQYPRLRQPKRGSPRPKTNNGWPVRVAQTSVCDLDARITD